MDIQLSSGALVLYKHRPARVRRVADKIEIELQDGQAVRVRPKDVIPLHPGPISRWDELEPQSGEVRTAWEILAGDTVRLSDLAELAFGVFSPATAWAAWELVADGLFFRGTPQEIIAQTADKVAQEQASRAAKLAEQRAWEGFLDRARAGHIEPDDGRYLVQVAALAWGRQDKSRVLRDLGRAEQPEQAHALLLELGYWDHTVNPYPRRLGLPTEPPDAALLDPLDLPDESRRDLTHLVAFAIDDEGNQDPDDAVSLDGDRLWVHVADVAALVPPGSPADRAARERGANLYLPEGTVPMLPPRATLQLGLGLQEVSPALSFGIDLSAEGEIAGVEIVPSWVRVTRLTYAEAETQLDQEPLRGLYRLAQRNEARRRKNGAVMIDLPEVRIRVVDGQVVIRPILPLKSRTLVTEAMLLTGEAAARFALDHDIPFGFATQPPPDHDDRPTDLAGMFALRRFLKPSEMSGHPAPHAGLGLEVYSRTTSPLRRYLDLVAHQQLRAFLRGEELIASQEMLLRIGAAEAVTGLVNQAERLSNRHWTLVYLQDHPDWRGEGVLVERRGARGIVLIPELDLEPRVHLRGDWPLNSPVPLALSGLNLPTLEAHLRVER